MNTYQETTVTKKKWKVYLASLIEYNPISTILLRDSIPGSISLTNLLGIMRNAVF
jgi:hypothetical protein